MLPSAFARAWNGGKIFEISPLIERGARVLAVLIPDAATRLRGSDTVLLLRFLVVLWVHALDCICLIRYYGMGNWKSRKRFNKDLVAKMMVCQKRKAVPADSLPM